jgi:TIR domain
MGLESVHFMGPAIIDHETITRSGELPTSFLQGCGLPDEVISFYESQAGAIRYYSCFISYSSADQEFVIGCMLTFNRMESDAGSQPRTCELVIDFDPVIDEAIRLHEKLLLVLSEYSIESDWVESEVEAAMERERRENRTILFPVRLDDAVMETKQAWAADIRRTRHIGDFRDWKNHDRYRESFERLVRDLRR